MYCREITGFITYHLLEFLNLIRQLGKNRTTESAWPVLLFTRVDSSFKILSCIIVAPVPGKLGIEDGRIGTTSLSASSCWDSNYCVARSRLNQPQEGALGGAWVALVSI